MSGFFNYLYRFRRNISVKGVLNSFSSFMSIRRIETYDILFLCHDNSRPIIYEGKYFSPLIDTLNLRFEKLKTLTLALPFSKLAGNKCFGNTINLNLYLIIALLRRVVKYRSYILADINGDPLIKFYDKLLTKIKVKVVIGVNPSVELCIAAERHGILVYDLQHGIIDDEEPTSYYSNAKREKLSNNGWPNFILCRNSQSYHKVSTDLKFTKPVLIGNLNKYFYINYYNKASNSGHIFSNNMPNILFTFQPFYDKEFEMANNFDGVIFPKTLLRMIENSKCNFILKLHPSQIQNVEIYYKYARFFKAKFNSNSNVDYKVCNERPLDFSLSISDLHITYNSASTYDAMDYNIKTIILDDNKERLNKYFGEILTSEFIMLMPDIPIDITIIKKVDDNLNQDYRENLDTFITYLYSLKKHE